MAVDRPNTREIWTANAPAWIELSRAGYDVFRDLVNTPAFLKMLPPVQGLRCLDLGCGEGHNPRLLAARGAEVVALDIADDATAAEHPEVADTRIVPYSLIVRATRT